MTRKRTNFTLQFFVDFRLYERQNAMDEPNESGGTLQGLTEITQGEQVGQGGTESRNG